MRVSLCFCTLIINYFFLDTKIVLQDSQNSLEVTLVLGDSLSTKVTFDGQNLKEKVIAETLASYK